MAITKNKKSNKAPPSKKVKIQQKTPKAKPRTPTALKKRPAILKKKTAKPIAKKAKPTATKPAIKARATAKSRTQKQAVAPKKNKKTNRLPKAISSKKARPLVKQKAKPTAKVSVVKPLKQAKPIKPKTQAVTVKKKAPVKKAARSVKRLNNNIIKTAKKPKIKTTVKPQKRLSPSRPLASKVPKGLQRKKAKLPQQAAILVETAQEIEAVLETLSVFNAVYEAEAEGLILEEAAAPIESADNVSMAQPSIRQDEEE